MPAPHKRLKEARERSGKSEEEAAIAAGLSLHNYYDLESYEDEVFLAVSLRQLKNVCKFFNITMRSLFEDASSSKVSGERCTFDALADLLQKRLEQLNQPIPEFEDRAGWGIGKFLHNPQCAWEWPVDQLRDICRELKVDWLLILDALDGEKEN